MARQTQNTFPSWGDTGDSPPAGTDYTSADNPKAQHYDYLWNELNVQFGNVTADFDRLDSDGDGVVDKADSGAVGFTFDGSAAFSTGEAVTDGGGTARFSINANNTRVNDETGTVALSANATNFTKLFTSSSRPFIITDNAQGGADGLRYEAGSTGTFKLANANLDLAGNSLTSSSGRIRLSSGGDNLEISEGSNILDQNGVRRFRIASTNTSIFDETGTNNAFFSETLTRFSLPSGKTWEVFDGALNSPSVQVTPSPDGTSPSTFKLTNANLDLNSNNISNVSQFNASTVTVSSTVELAGGPDGGATIESFGGGNGEGRLDITSAHGPDTTTSTHHNFIGQDDAGNSQSLLQTFSSGLIKFPNGGLRLPTGGSIIGGSGNARFTLGGSTTGVTTGAAGDGLTGFTLTDATGGFTAVEYEEASTASGNFKLTNADLDLAGNDIKNAGSRRFLEKVTSGSATVQPSSDEVVLSNMSNEILLAVNAKNTTQGSSGVEVIYGNESGELVLRNKDGGDSVDVSYTAYRAVA